MLEEVRFRVVFGDDDRPVCLAREPGAPMLGRVERCPSSLLRHLRHIVHLGSEIFPPQHGALLKIMP